MKPLSNRAFDAVTRLFHSVSGIKLTEAKHALVTGRLQRMATEAGEPDLEAYVDKLLRGGAPAQEMTKLIDRLTTNETYFFREPQHYNDLADRLTQVPAGQQFNVWSAASSSGEEAYSTAMLLSEQLTHAPWQIIGTDLQQIWLDHLLVLSMVQHDSRRWSWGRYVLVHPAGNLSFARLADRYRSLLVDNRSFDVITLEELLGADGPMPTDLRVRLVERYLW